MTMNKAEKRDLLLFDDSPPAGHPDCKCSVCLKTICEVPVERFYCPELKKELRLHRHCKTQMMESGKMRRGPGMSDEEKKKMSRVVMAASTRMVKRWQDMQA